MPKDSVFKLIEPWRFSELDLTYPLELKRGEAVCVGERMGIAFKHERFNNANELVRWIDAQFRGDKASYG
jgi:hypothetical protein